MNIVKLLRHCCLLCLIASYARSQSVIVPVDANGSGFYVDTDRTVNQLYWTNNAWLNVNLTAASQSAARVAQGTSLALADGSVYFVGTDQTINQLYVGKWSMGFRESHGCRPDHGACRLWFEPGGRRWSSLFCWRRRSSGSAIYCKWPVGLR